MWYRKLRQKCVFLWRWRCRLINNNQLNMLNLAVRYALMLCGVCVCECVASSNVHSWKRYEFTRHLLLIVASPRLLLAHRLKSKIKKCVENSVQLSSHTKWGEINGSNSDDGSIKTKNKKQKTERKVDKNINKFYCSTWFRSDDGESLLQLKVGWSAVPLVLGIPLSNTKRWKHFQGLHSVVQSNLVFFVSSLVLRLYI